MADPIQLILKLIDQVTPTLQKINQEIGATQSQVNRGVSFAGLEGNLGSLGKAASAVFGGMKSGIGDAVGAISGLFSPLTAVSFGFNQITQSVQTMMAAARPAYEFLIGSNERLNAQLLSSQTNLASATRIFKNGVEIKDPTEKIKSTRPQLEAALKQIEKETEDLVGVTSAQVNELFQITLQNASQLNNQSKQFPGPIQAATSLTKGWAASLKVIGLPLSQAAQEVNSILRSSVDQNSMLAKNLNITNEQINKWKAQGTLVDEINKRLETFVAGNAIAAQSIEGISSNIQDAFEILGREVGKPLLQPVINALDAGFKYIKANREAVIGFFKSVVDESLLSGQSIAQNLKPIFGVVAGLAQAIAPGFNAVFQTVLKLGEVVAATLSPVITLLGVALTPAIQAFSIIFQVLDSILGLFMQAFRATQPVRDAIAGIALQIQGFFNQFGDGWTNAIADVERFISASIAAIQPFLNFLGSQIGGAAQAAIKALEPIGKFFANLFGGAMTVANNFGKAAITSLQLISKEVANSPIGKVITALLKELDKLTGNSFSKGAENFNKAFNQTADAAKGAADQTTFQAKELDRLGNTYEQLEKKVNNAQRVIVEQGSGDPERFKAAAKELIDLTNQQVQSGAITEAEGQKRLQALADNTKLEFSLQQSAKKAIADLAQSANQEEIDGIKRQQLEIEEQLGEGYISQQEASKRLTELKRSELEKQREFLNAELQRELAQGGANESDRAKKLRQQLSQTEAEIGKNTRKQQEENFNRRLQDFDEQQKILEGKRAQGLVSEQQFNDESFKLTMDRLNVEAETIQQERARLSKDDKEGMEALAAREAEIQKKRVDAIEKYENEKIAILDRAQKKALDVAKMAETSRDIETQKLLNARQIREVEANELNLQAKQATTREELRLEQEKVKALEALPKLSDPVKEEARQAKIRASRQRTADLTLQTLKNEYALEEARTRVIQDRIDQQLKVTINNFTQEQQLLQQSAMAQDYKVKAIERQNTLLNAQKDLQSAISGYVSGQYQLAESLTTSESRKRRIQEEAARSRLAFLAREQALERQSLELEIQRNQAMLLREQIQNRIEQSKAKADVATAQAELEKARADKKTTPAELRAKELAVQAASDRAVGTQYQGLLLDEQERQQGALDNARRRGLQYRQELQTDQARSSLAQITRTKSDDRVLAAEFLQKARNAADDSTAIVVPQSTIPTFEQFSGRREAIQAQINQVVGGSGGVSTVAPVQRNLPAQSSTVLGGDGQVIQLLSDIKGAMEGLSNASAQPINQTNSITNHFTGEDIQSGQMKSKVKQDVLNVLYDVARLAKN
ncbi:hypothetical protein NIES2135_21080 [Leptolyngbya boryana NIES-2135]|uniref:Uncharacterized protein n=1 Tax=Leptolyngbya boryana NIES-2135 TaxID=1973484 RepID=A0A1Z4JES3_LEPBY|nr:MULTISPECIES: hypothetical protein [Leptolyngbya]BAY55285.1 hypothetical protein NIES2135_21080 [Leptolyngbya boryana NIES-2135]MBD2369369.1 hypothetical protein [Leptolyngbya sp. FACHB-161]MBD2375629.1 hypothetical protein [Leptolyngbya sp. FACHB-238]MBD2401698.1 hypothetical protein [Leptolyngbya sp. FACHB-239]MBD2406563.1 hypothetical protein [Leptolyngbya sp. FACHB-402]